ncbi:amidohydrolase family protein [Pseudonocardia sp. TRM90224]|uniref:amidohydrolase family protein n=1 Tax=Pseudonocardia sp. TRM90224 TaxID=2812678 RepID=UPI001E6302DE|nr:amidohydrolase family protein [Pseudonocardia sp. TRM90224]
MTAMMPKVIDAHVRLGAGREVSLETAALLGAMDELGIEHAVIAPGERCTVLDEPAGNTATTTAAGESAGRLRAWAVANPWRGRDALVELARAAELGAVGLAVDPQLQGFDLHDGLLDPLLELADDRDWPVYVRGGVAAAPLTLALLAARYPDVPFLLGGARHPADVVAAMRHAPNLSADTTSSAVLDAVAADPDLANARLVFTSDSPYRVAGAELARVREWAGDDPSRAGVLGANLDALLPAPTSTPADLT